LVYSSQMSAPFVLFPCYPTKPREIDPSFAEEFEAARRAGFQVGFIGIESDDVSLVLPNVVGLSTGVVTALYRGWILTEADYGRMAKALSERNVELVTGQESYLNCYYLPNWYRQLKGLTPKSTWTVHNKPSKDDVKFLTSCIQKDFTGGVVLKDYVKSRKHEWLDACYIPDVADGENTLRVIGNFVERQEDLVGGLVFREYVDLRIIGKHPKSELPLANEHRFFVLNDKVIYEGKYWPERNYDGWALPEPNVLSSVLGKVKSPFYAVDVAEKTDGTWTVVEVNDGGTAGVPEGGSVKDFYEALMRHYLFMIPGMVCLGSIEDVGKNAREAVQLVRDVDFTADSPKSLGVERPKLQSLPLGLKPYNYMDFDAEDIPE
jgi:hypothetical protein